MISLLDYYYQQFDADYTLDVPAEGYGGWKSGRIDIDPSRTAVVLMHAWDVGTRDRFPGLYRACDEIPRTGTICRTVLPGLLAAVRAAGLTLFHVVDGAGYFEHYPGWQRAVALAGADGPPLPQAEADEAARGIRRFRSDHVFVGAHNMQDTIAADAHKRFAAEAEPQGDEGIARNAAQLFALCREAGINHLIYAGFNIDWCLLMSAGGMIDMARRGFVCSAFRQAVTAVENRETARRELCKEIGLWRVSVQFGCVFDVPDFVESIRGRQFERQRRPAPAAPPPALPVSRSIPMPPGVMPAIPAQTWIEIDGVTYGARPDEAGSIGGGPGYRNVVACGDFTVASEVELLDALGKARAGQTIYIDPAAELDFTDRVFTDAPFALRVPAGVTLASNRGLDGSPGALIASDAFQTSPLIEPAGPGVRISGLRLRGPDMKRRLAFHHRVFYECAKGHDGGPEYYRFPNSDAVRTDHADLEVDNCEIFGWSHSGVTLQGGAGHRIHHNDIHHNQRMGLGYGVCTHKQARTLIEFNRFRDNKHHVAGSGEPGSAYEARHNVILPDSELHLNPEGTRYGQDHLFDMHGGRDRRDGTQVAASWLKIHHNTFIHTHVAVVIRGVPEDVAEVHHNWFFHPGPGKTTVVTDGRTVVGDNVYGPPPAPPLSRPPERTHPTPCQS